MPNSWVEHVKAYATEHKCGYKEAMKLARPSYKKKEKGIKGGFFEKRTAGKLPPSSRKLLEKIGNEKITSLELERTPILGWFNIITFGRFYKFIHKLHYDHMFHLSLVINGKYRLEKTQVVQIYPVTPLKDVEKMNVPIPPEYDATIDDMINITRDYMGVDKFSNYNVADNNCQIFLDSVLKANGLNTPETHKFISQDVETVIKNYPGAKKIITAATNLAAKWNRLVEGEGKKKKKVMKGCGNDLQFPDTPRGILYKMSSSEMSYLKDVYYSTGTYNGYDVVQVQMYYPDNFAIGGLGKFGWKQFPRSKDLGYHKHDVEKVAIYYLDGKPVKVIMSCHGMEEYNIYSWDEVQKQDGFMVVYVARNSHANYKNAKIQKRVEGLGNDITADDGKQIKMTWQEMKPATRIDYPGVSPIYPGVAPQPTQTVSMSQDQRWEIDRKHGYI